MSTLDLVHSNPVGKSYDRTLFASTLVHVGEFRCPVGHPCFNDSGPTEMHCFVFPRTAVWIQHEGRAPFVADPNVVPLYNPGHPYRRQRISAAGDQTDWFGVAPEVLREMVAMRDPRAADSDTLFRFDAAPARAGTYVAQRQVVRHVRAHPHAETLFVEESAINLLNGVLDAAYEDARCSELERRRARDLAERTREHLNRSYRSHEGLGALAKEVDSSVFHLCRVFKQQTGHTIHQYRTQLRLRKALELLESADADILGVALHLGFSGHSHFTRTFHWAYGVTPSEFRSDLCRSGVKRAGPPGSALKFTPWSPKERRRRGNEHPLVDLHGKRANGPRITGTWKRSAAGCRPPADWRGTR